jgi:hypothetical protein
MAMTRKRFLESLAGSTAVLFIQGCGGGGGYSGSAPAPAPSPTPSTTCSGSNITGNHGHAIVIQKTDLDSSTAMTYSIMGGASHDHTITLTPTMLTQLKAGTMVTTTSSTTLSHNHDVTVTCA